MTIQELRDAARQFERAHREASLAYHLLVGRGAHPVQIAKQRERVARFLRIVADIRAEIVITESEQ